MTTFVYSTIEAKEPGYYTCTSIIFYHLRVLNHDPFVHEQNNIYIIKEPDNGNEEEDTSIYICRYIV